MELEDLIDQALVLGASYASIINIENHSSEITVENGKLKNHINKKRSGVGIRVLVDGVLGITASTSIKEKILRQQLEYIITVSKNTGNTTEKIHLSDEKAIKISSKLPYVKKIDSDEEMIALAIDVNKTAMLEGVKNSTTNISWLSESRIFRSSEGTDLKSELSMVGLAQSCVSRFQGNIESVSESISDCGGLEFISKKDWNKFSEDIAETSLKAVRAKVPKAGFYRVIADPSLIGLILHEAFGHACEADLVTTGESVLDGHIGDEVTSPQITIIDDGLVKGGFFFPYDDEGVAKRRQVLIQKGVLKSFLHSRETAYKMDTKSTGNARVESFGNKPVVRQSNLFMDKGEQGFEELIDEVENGLYICGRGSRGGEVDTGIGAFTFRAGPSYIIKKGEIDKMVRGVSVSGTILETLKNVEAVGKDVKVKTSIFGGCGKSGQLVKVGHGGPHIRIGKIMVGGSY